MSLRNVDWNDVVGVVGASPPLHYVNSARRIGNTGTIKMLSPNLYIVIDPLGGDYVVDHAYSEIMGTGRGGHINDTPPDDPISDTI
ncbi:MAG: hypothetical protein D6712_15210 [Chloroflexi bacterium]|nr:MAG: hypothetical protein D6712_15210 [Chloroflexota bacterium]